MLWNFLRLAWLFGAISPSFSSPYGNIGCHFSEVCTESEDCTEDNLFGSCVNSGSVSLPFYDVSRDGFRDLKIVIRFLLDRGYQWRDEAAQKTLETILGQYRMEYVDAEMELEANYQREQQLEALEQMAAQYGSLFFNRKTNDRLEEEEEMSRNYGPAYYTEEEKRRYIPENKVARGTSRDELEDLIQEYVQAIKDSTPREKEEEVNWMYHEYYQKYLDLLEQYRAMERAAENELAEGEEYGEESTDYYAEVQDKLDYLKQYLEEIYQGEVEEEEEEEEEEARMEGSDEGMMEGGMSQSSSSWWDASSSSISEGGVEEILAEAGIDRLAVQLINNELIPQMTPQEQDQWKRLNEEEKEGIIQEALQAIDWVAMEMEAEDEKGGGGVQREMVAEAMKGEEEEEEAEVEEAEVEEEEAIEAAMKDGEWLNEGAESPLFEPEEENEGDKELQLDVLLPLEKKGDDDDDVDGDARDEELVDVGDKDMHEGENEEEEEDEKEENKEPEYSGFIFITFKEDITEEDADEIVALLVSLLELPPSIFSDIKVKDKEITVHVNDSSRHFTPKAIAIKIAGIQRKLAAMMGVHMVVTGVGHDVSTELNLFVCLYVCLSV
ncbi:glutamic acid-rich protein isoform X1 [Strongylocentrotus purpuratus]|uniref:Protein-tyrosine phosphatase receptor IA-2 ectodomain domain-containing protein n=1 Tax=Strongylocentrotus purpuratus TaxID=7668 RepID=A0A7M7T150_STRPU|nr:glutamic acid-rich protein isoform X1 [Strongylocentrotus purpuratus]